AAASSGETGGGWEKRPGAEHESWQAARAGWRPGRGRRLFWGGPPASARGGADRAASRAARAARGATAQRALGPARTPAERKLTRAAQRGQHGGSAADEGVVSTAEEWSSACASQQTPRRKADEPASHWWEAVADHDLHVGCAELEGAARAEPVRLRR